MKKLLVILTGLLLLAGCGASANATPSFNETLFTIGNQSVNQRQLFEVMKRADQGSTLVQEAQAMITSTVEETEALKQEAEERWKMIEDQLGVDAIEATLKDAGFASKDDYIQKVIMPELKMVQLIRDRLSSDYETLASTYTPKKIRFIEIDSEEKAKEALSKLSNNTAFDEVAKEYSSTPTTPNETMLYLKETDASVPPEVKGFVEATNETKLSDVLVSQSTGKFFIAQILSTDAEELKTETLEALIDTQSVSNEYLGKVFREFNFRVYDEELYNKINESYPQYFKETEAKE